MDNLFLKSYIQQQQQQQQAHSSSTQHHHLYHHLHQTTNENSYQTPMPNVPSQPYSYHTAQYTNMPQPFFNHQQQTNPNYFYVNQLNASPHPTHQQIQSYTYQTIYPPTSNDVSNPNHLSVYNPVIGNIKFNKPMLETSTSTLTSSSSNNESIADVTNIPKYTKPRLNQKLSDERAFLPPPPPRLPPPPPPSTSSMPSGLLPAPYQPPPPPTYEFITR